MVCDRYCHYSSKAKPITWTLLFFPYLEENLQVFQASSLDCPLEPHAIQSKLKSISFDNI